MTKTADSPPHEVETPEDPPTLNGADLDSAPKPKARPKTVTVADPVVGAFAAAKEVATGMKKLTARVKQPICTSETAHDRTAAVPLGVLARRKEDERHSAASKLVPDSLHAGER